jgi:2-methylisocitrate lyase-like PEP mutase family enzyme
MKPTRKLCKLLEDAGIIILPGAYDCIGAKIIESEGFKAVYMTGAGTAAARTGRPDVGLITMSEMVDNARRMAASVEIPLITDCDTGYGNQLNVMRSVEEFESAGVAGIQIEDQVFPKKCGHYEGKQVIPKEEMVQKIKAAVDTRKDDDFAVIARTDAIAVQGFEDALERGRAYMKAGADVLFIEAPRSMDEIETIGRSFSIPLLFNMPTSGKTPLIPAKEMERLGFKIALYAGVGMYIYAYTMKKYLKTLLETGSWEDYKDEMVPFKDFWNIMGLEEIRKLEEKYSVK